MQHNSYADRTEEEGRRREEEGGWQLRARVVPTQVLERSTRMSACFVSPDEIAQERAIEEKGGEGESEVVTQ